MVKGINNIGQLLKPQEHIFISEYINRKLNEVLEKRKSLPFSRDDISLVTPEQVQQDLLNSYGIEIDLGTCEYYAKVLNEEILQSFIHWQPDLFLIMSEEELTSSLEYIRSIVGESYLDKVKVYNFLGHDIFSPEIYKLLVNNHDAAKYIFDQDGNHVAMFSEFSHYIVFPLQKNDFICFAISPTLWPESADINAIVTKIQEFGFQIEDYTLENASEIQNRMIAEANFSRIHPSVSPWTLRDNDSLESALTVGPGGAIESFDDIESISVVSGANIQLIFSVAIPFRSSAGPNNMPIDDKLRNFFFPNAIIIHTKDGNKTLIYTGAEITLENIDSRLKKNGLDSFATTEPFNQEEIGDFVKELLLLPRNDKKM